MNTTARLGLQKPGTSDATTALRTAIGRVADALDDAAIDLQGTLAARPTSTSGSPGLRGRYYFATDTGQLFRDTGTSWVDVTATPDASITKAKLATDALNAFLKLATGADRKADFGSVATPPAFNGANRAALAVNHNLGVAPSFVYAFAGYIGAPSTSTGQDEVVNVSQYAKTASTITFKLSIGNGATAAVGASAFYWLAIA